MKSIRLSALAALIIAALLVMPGSASAWSGLRISGAQGEPKAAALKYPVSVTAERYDSGPLTLLDTEHGKLSCEAIALASPYSISEPEDSLKLRPRYPGEDNKNFSGCKFFRGTYEYAATVTSNGCGVKYTNFEHDAGPAYQATAEIYCPEGKEFRFTFAQCEMSIPAQGLNQKDVLTNTYAEGAEHINALTTASGLTYKVHSFACEVGGIKKGTYEDGTTEMDLLVRDVFMTGGAAKVEAPSYPTTVTGIRYQELPYQEGKLEVLDTGLGELLCEEAEVDGGTLSGPAYEIALVPAYSECTYYDGNEYNLSATVSMNSCRYVGSEFTGDEAGGYLFEGDLDCATEGDAIKISLYSCTMRIPAQPLTSDSIAINTERYGVKGTGAGVLGSDLEFTTTGTGCGWLLELPKGSYTGGSSEVYFRLG